MSPPLTPPVAASLPDSMSPPHRSTIYRSDLPCSCFSFYALRVNPIFMN
jgi:hypothetical protein